MEKEFFVKKSMLNLYLFMGIIGVLAVLIASGGGLILTVVGLMHYFYFRKNSIFNFKDGDLIYNPSVLAGKRYFTLDELEEISVQEKKISFKNQDKNVTLSMSLLSDEDKKTVKDIFSKQIEIKAGV